MIDLLNKKEKRGKLSDWSLLFSLVFLILSITIFASCKKSTLSPGTEEEHDHGRLDEITLTSEAIRTGGIEIQELQPVKLRSYIRVPGEIKFNPRLYHRLTSRISGRVEQILAYEGDRVKQGQCLVRLFSLPFLESVTELRLAHERWQRLNQLDREEKQAAWSILESARVKLKILGLSDNEIDELLKSPETNENYQLYCLKCPVSGQVISRQVLTGDQVEAGSVLMEIASTEVLWVEILVQEKDVGRISAGTEAIIQVQSYPGMDFKGKLSYLGPLVEESTRLVKGRLEIKNQNGLLKPGMYADVFLPTEEINTLAIPEVAVQEISGQKVAFVQVEEGKFKTIPIVVGAEIDGWFPVLQGLKPGDKYVSHGAFLIKSELLKSTFEGDGHHHD